MNGARRPLTARTAISLLTAMTVVPLVLRGLFAANVELSPDEAYYATWALRLDGSYFDHPPMVALMIAAGRAIFGHNELGVRAAGLLLGAVLPWFLYGASRALGASRGSALWATFAATTTLVCSAGAVIVTPDTPLSLFFAAAVFFAARLMGDSNGVRASALVATYVGTSVSLACALASKLTAVLLWGQAALLPALGSPARRMLILAPALLGLTSVAAWNLAHDWPMFAFHAARISERAGFAPNFAAEFLAAQLALLNVGPGLLVAAACVAGLRKGAPGPLRSMVYWTLGPLAATTILALFTKVEANWIAPAFLPAFVALALWLDGRVVHHRPLRMRWLLGACLFSLITTLVAHVHVAWPFLPIPLPRDPSAQLRGARTLSDAVRVARQHAGRTLPVLASRYQEASILAFYLPDSSVTTLAGGARKSQFDLWPADARDAHTALCVFREGEAPPAGARVEAAGQVFYLSVCRPSAWRLSSG